jgi:hypothetical protein
METNQQKTSELFGESAKIANKWFSDAASSMMEIYNKQLNMTFGFYNNLFSSFSGQTTRNPSLIFPNAFGNGNGDTKAFFNPFSWMQDENKILNPLSNVYQGMFKQLTEYNKNLLRTLQNNFQLQQNDLTMLGEKYQQVLEKDWQAVKNSLNSISEAYNARIESSMDFNKKLAAELNRLSNILIRNNEEFWSQAAKSYQANSQANSQTDKTKKTDKKEVVEAVS